MRDRGLQGVEAIIQWQQRVFAEGDNDRLLFDAQHRRMGLLGAGRQILDRRALLPLGDGLLVDPVTLGQNPQALLTILYRSTDRCCRAGSILSGNLCLSRVTCRFTIEVHRLRFGRMPQRVF